MKQIWKFLVEDGETEMPIGAKILNVQMQGLDPFLWAIVDPKNKKEMRRFQLVGTGQGHECLNNGIYMGTFQTPPFVWHLFEVKL